MNIYLDFTGPDQIDPKLYKKVTSSENRNYIIFSLSKDPRKRSTWIGRINFVDSTGTQYFSEGADAFFVFKDGFVPTDNFYDLTKKPLYFLSYAANQLFYEYCFRYLKQSSGIVLSTIREFGYCATLEPKRLLPSLLVDRQSLDNHKQNIIIEMFIDSYSRFGDRYFDDEVDMPLNLEIAFQAIGFENQHVLSLKIFEDEIFKLRFFAFIGENGTGKSIALASLAETIRSQTALIEVLYMFHENKIKNDSVGKINLSQITSSKFDSALSALCFRSQRYKDFDISMMIDNVLASSLGISHLEVKIANKWRKLSDVIGIGTSKPITSHRFYVGETEIIASHGQKVLCYMLISILGRISRKTLLLVDEFEAFLHPHAIVSFMAGLAIILRETSSFAVFSTHSPIVAREIPKSHMLVFKRVVFNSSSVIQISSPANETLGESLDRLNKDLFNDDYALTNYKIAESHVGAKDLSLKGEYRRELKDYVNR